MAAQHNVVISWWSELVPQYVNKKHPGLLDSTANGVVPFAGTISGISSGVKEERGI